MALVFERIVTEGLGDLGYLIGDDSAGTAAVIDPQADVDVYLQLAPAQGRDHPRAADACARGLPERRQ